MRRKTVGYMVLDDLYEPRWLGRTSTLRPGGYDAKPEATLFSTRKAAKRAIARTQKEALEMRAYGFQGPWDYDEWRIVRLVSEQTRKESK